MKGFLRQYLTALTALFVTPMIFPGLVISNGFYGLLLASLFLTIGFVVVKPILTIVTLPLGIITLGLFSVAITAFVLFLITMVDHNFSILPFQVQAFSFLGNSLPSFQANIFLSYVLISVTIQFIYRIFNFAFEL